MVAEEIEAAVGEALGEGGGGLEGNTNSIVLKKKAYRRNGKKFYYRQVRVLLQKIYPCNRSCQVRQ